MQLIVWISGATHPRHHRRCAARHTHHRAVALRCVRSFLSRVAPQASCRLRCTSISSTHVRRRTAAPRIRTDRTQPSMPTPTVADYNAKKDRMDAPIELDSV